MTVSGQDPSALIDFESTNQGVLIPRNDTSSVNTAFTPTKGLLIFQISDSTFYYFNGTFWQQIIQEQDPEVGTLSINDVPRWDGDSLKMGIITDDGSRVGITGNLGVGTTNPTPEFAGRRVLEIEGIVPQLLLDDVGGSATDNFRIKNGGAFAQFENGTTGQDIMALGLTSFPGDVGIGTNAPTSRLHVASTVGQINIEDTDDNAILSLLASGAGYTGGVGYAGAFDLSLFTNNIDRLFIKSSGEVGIGNTNPTGQLSFSNAVASRKITLYDAANNDHEFLGFGTGGGFMRYQVDATTTAHIFYAGTSPTSSNELLRITGEGDVGIGISSPAGLLELNLDEGLKPSTSTWTISSDERLKSISGSYTKGLNEILQLLPIRYKYINSENCTFDPVVLNSENVGFSAQAVKEIFPESISEDKNGYLQLNMHAIIVAQVNAIKELQKNMDAQRDLIEQQNMKITELVKIVKSASELQAEILALKSQNVSLHKRLNELEEIRQDKN